VCRHDFSKLHPDPRSLRLFLLTLANSFCSSSWENCGLKARWRRWLRFSLVRKSAESGRRYIAWPGQALSYYMGELAIVRAREKAEKTLEANGADGISDIEGKVARVATSKLGNERVSNSTSALSTMLCSSSARSRCPLSRRGSTVSSRKTAKARTRIWSK